MQSATACCTSSIPLPEAHAFEPAGDRDVALQILAANFGLAGFILKRRRASRASRSLPVELLVIMVLRI